MREVLKIYIADLVAYNAGYLHGVWIDATEDLETVQEQIREMLANSPVDDAEEYALHDYEGFGALRLSEYTGIPELLALAEFIEETPEIGTELLSHFGSNVDEANQALEHYAGSYDSLADFAQEITEETTEIPEHLQFYIDYEHMARDMEISGDVYTVTGDGGQVHVFWGH